MERILAFDCGRRRIGVALSDELGLYAQGLPTLTGRNQKDGWDQAVETVAQHKPAQIVVGMPLNLDGSKSDMVAYVENFIAHLEAEQNAPIVRVDERLTSVGAKKQLKGMGVKQKGNKGQVDRLSAVYLLEIYLQQQGQLGQV